MKSGRSILTVMTCALLTSCATPALWEATDPHEFVAIAQSKTTEQELKARGLAYRVDAERNLVYVEKTRFQKTRDYAIRTLGTPVTFALDAATTIAVVGAAVYVMAHTDERYLEAARREREQAEWEAIRKTLDAIRREEQEDPNTASHGTGYARP